MSKSIVVRLNKEQTYRHLHTLCQNDGLFTIIDYPYGWQDKDYERIVISDQEALRSGKQRAVIGTVRLLPYDNGTAVMFVNKDAIWHNEISKSGEKLFIQYIERAVEHFAALDLILHKPADAKNKSKAKTKASNLSSPQKKLSALRDELVEINTPSYPDDPYGPLKNWIAKVTPIIRIEWFDAFDDFNSLIILGGWTKADMATYVDIVTYGNAMPNSNEHRKAWDDDVKEVQQLSQKILNFLDGLLLVIPKETRNLSLSTRTAQYIGDNPHVAIMNTGNMIINGNVIGENIYHQKIFEPAYQKITQAQLSNQEKQDLQSEVADIEKEVNKGDSANENFLARRLRGLQKMAPDISDVVLASLISPSIAVATVVKKVAEKIKSGTTD